MSRELKKLVDLPGSDVGYSGKADGYTTILVPVTNTAAATQQAQAVQNLGAPALMAPVLLAAVAVAYLKTRNGSVRLARTAVPAGNAAPSITRARRSPARLGTTGHVAGHVAGRDRLTKSVSNHVVSGTRSADDRAKTHPSDKRVFPPPGTTPSRTTSTETAPFPAAPRGTTPPPTASTETAPFPAVLPGTAFRNTTSFPTATAYGDMAPFPAVPAERASSVRHTPSGEPVRGQDPKTPEEPASGPYRGRRRLSEGSGLYQVGALADALEATWKSTRSDDVDSDNVDDVYDSGRAPHADYPDYADYSAEFDPKAAPRGRRHRPDDSSAPPSAQPPTGVRGRHRKN